MLSGNIVPFELCFAFLSLTQDIWSMSSPLCFVCALNLSFPQSCWSLNDLCGGCNCAASALWSSLKTTEGSCFSKEVHLSNWTFDEWQNDQTFNCGPKAWHLVYKLDSMELRLKNLIFLPWPPSPLPYSWQMGVSGGKWTAGSTLALSVFVPNSDSKKSG